MRRFLQQLCFSCFCHIILGSRLRGDGNEFWKTKIGFCPKQSHSQKILSVLQHLLSFERFEFIFVAYFQGLNYLIISCFSHKFPTRISINSRGIFKKQERFLFITDSFKSNSLICFTGVTDREIEGVFETQNFQEFAKFPQIRFVIFGLIIFKYFELSCK